MIYLNTISNSCKKQKAFLLEGERLFVFYKLSYSHPDDGVMTIMTMAIMMFWYMFDSNL